MKVGIIGTAHMHITSYLRCMNELEVKVTGIFDENVNRRKEFANASGINEVGSLAQLFATGCDTVVICSENVLHHKHALAAAENHCHIIIEKPMALSTKEADQMIEAAERNDVKLLICHPVRFTPVMQEMKKLIKNGEIGEVYAINATNHGKNPGGWFVNKKLSGGGALIDHTVHIADLIYWLFDKKIESITANSATTLHDIPVEDTGLIHATFTDGTIMSLDTSWNRPLNFPVWGDATMEIISEKGQTIVDGFGRYSDSYSNTRNQERIYYETDMDMSMFKVFKDVIEQDLPLPIDGYAGKYTIQLFEMAYQSIEEHKTIKQEG